MADTMSWSIRQYFFSENYAPQNIYIEYTLKALYLLVSEIDVLLRELAAILYKCSPKWRIQSHDISAILF